VNEVFTWASFSGNGDKQNDLPPSSRPLRVSVTQHRTEGSTVIGQLFDVLIVSIYRPH